MADLLSAVEEGARIAGEVVLNYFGKIEVVDTKSDGSPVTIADRQSEETVRQWIKSRFPKDGIVGEEFGIDLPEASRKWLIDPIDGTLTFVRRVPLYGTLIAVVEQDQVLAGAIFCPSVNEMVVAAVGEGCWWNGSRSSVSSVSELSKATILSTDERLFSLSQREAWTHLGGQVEVSRTWGDCYGYLLVASGRAEVMADGGMHDWDAAAPFIAVSEAGGVFTDWQGSKTAFGKSGIATNSALSGEVRSLLI